MLSKQTLNAAAADVWALLTVAIHTESDAAIVEQARQTVRPRSDEDVEQWSERLLTFIAAETAILNGVINGLARRLGMDVDDLVQLCAIRHAARRNEGEQQ